LPGLVLSLAFISSRPFASTGFMLGMILALLLRQELSPNSFISAGIIFWGCIVITDPVTISPTPWLGGSLGLIFGFLPLVLTGSVIYISLGILFINGVSYIFESVQVRTKPGKRFRLKRIVPFLYKETQFIDLTEHEKSLSYDISCLSAKEYNYSKKQSIFMFGDTPKNFGIVLSGNVQVVKEDYYGNRSIVAMIGEGMLFGEVFAFADIKKLPVSVIATTESKILLIDYDKLIHSCTQACSFHSKLIYNLLHIVASKNIMLNQKIELLSKRTTREKLLAYLMIEAQKTGSNSFHIAFNRQELADYLSVDRSAMSAELGKLRDEGVIEFHKNQFKLKHS
jgi:CRP-like cAMP-binding protein